MIEDRANMTMEYLDENDKLVIHKDIACLTIIGDRIKIKLRNNVEYEEDLSPTSLIMFKPCEQRIVDYMELKGWITEYPKSPSP